MFYIPFAVSTTGGIYDLRQLQLRPAAGSSPVGSPPRLAVADIMCSDLFADVAVGEMAGKEAEGVAGEDSDKDANDDVAEIVFADEDAAYGYHCCPEEHPCAVGFEPCWKLLGLILYFGVSSFPSTSV